jgi:glutathione synthase/RimK-type ligase-like ATP-grasp enzyme
MILLGGIPSESSLAMVRAQAEELGLPFALFNQRRAAESAMEMEVAGEEVTGWMVLDGRRHRLEDFTGIYLRAMDDQALPELEGEPPASLRRRRIRAFHDTLARWSEISPARVVNRVAAMLSNASKPYQSQVIRAHGFAVPETLITNDPERVLAFRAQHGRIVYKSMSGVRSIVETLEDRDCERLGQIRWCPTQFQQFIPGTNVRVHTIGEAVLASGVATTATDYRYARQQVGETAAVTAISLETGVAERCVRLARAFGLAFAGVDLKITPQGEIYCFEVNPAPAFSYYESNTGQPIARELARYLAGMTST